jgi:hypothetical protein
VVTSAGALARGNGVDSVGRLSTGEYRVDFNRPVAACAHLVVQGRTGVGTKPAEAQGFAETSGDSTGTDKVKVYTFDKGGSSFDRSFHLAVMC